MKRRMRSRRIDVGKPHVPKRDMGHPVFFGDGSAHSLSGEEVVEGEQDDGAEERHQEAGGLVGAVVTDEAAEVGAEEGAGDTDQCGDDEAAGIVAGHDHFGDDPDDETNDDDPDEMKHAVLLSAA